MELVRQQLTLFIPRQDATEVEAIRQRHNPVQRALIDSHVTLCREDELILRDQILQNLATLRQPPLVIKFGDIVRSEGGKGVLLPAIAGHNEFQRLRQAVLQGVIDRPRAMEPHVTLLHPRNSTCTDAIFEDVKSRLLPAMLRFDVISLIEQIDGGPWQIQKTFKLSANF